MNNNTDPIKILIALHQFPPHYNNSVSVRALRTATMLRRRGHKVRIICIEDDQAADPSCTWRDDVYEDIPVRRLSFNADAFPAPNRFEYDNDWMGEQTRLLMNEDTPDVLHLIGGQGMTISPLRTAQMLGIPTVLSLTDYWFLCKRTTLFRSDGTRSGLPINPAHCAQCLGETQAHFQKLARIAPKIMAGYWRNQHTAIERVTKRQTALQQALHQVDAVLSSSKFMRETFVATGVQPDQIVCAEPGCTFAPREGERAKIPAKELRLAYFGQIDSMQGIHVLVDAVKRLSKVQVHLSIYGNVQQDPAYVNDLAMRIGDDRRIEIKGPYSPKNFTQLLQHINVVVLPSLWYEADSAMVQAAWAHKTPMVVSALGALADGVQHDVNGLCFEAGNANALAAQLSRLVDEPMLLKTLSDGITPVKTVHEEINELEGVYRQVLVGYAKPARPSLPIKMVPSKPDQPVCPTEPPKKPEQPPLPVPEVVDFPLDALNVVKRVRVEDMEILD